MLLLFPEDYETTVLVLPYRSGATAGGLASIAGIAGVRIPLTSGDQTITADLYPVVSNTIAFRAIVLGLPVRPVSGAKVVSVHEYLQSYPGSGVRPIIGRLVAGLRDVTAPAVTANDPMTQLADSVSDSSYSRAYPEERFRLLEELGTRIHVTTDRKTQIVKIGVRMPDAVASADIAAGIARVLMERIIEYEGKKSRDQLTFIERQLSTARGTYEEAQSNLAEYSDRNRTLASAVARIEQVRLQNEATLAFEVYQELSRQFEQAKIKVNQDTPVYDVLEPAIVPLDRAGVAGSLKLLLAILVVGSLWLLVLAFRGAPRFKPD
jgi:uncharacterized protein involved in exopolysaccharide biosynthesis